MLERDYFGGIVRPQIGVQIGKYNINDLMAQSTGDRRRSDESIHTAG
jgi:hypothetical protein